MKQFLSNGYVVAVLATAVILFFLWLLQPVMGEPPLLVFLLAVMLATRYGGVRAGLLATLLSALASAYFLEEPLYSLHIAEPGERLRVVVLIGMGSLTTLLIKAMRKADLRALRRSIEKQKQLESGLREKEETEKRFRWAVEAAPNGMILINQNGRIVLANAQAERMFGYASDELVGEVIETLVPERFHEQHVRDRRNFLALPQTRPMGKGRELCGRRKDGREVPVEIGLSPIATSEGILVMTSVIDITERKRLEESLREREARYSLLAENVPEILYTADADGRCDYVSQRYYALTGQPPGSACGEGWIEAVHPDDRARVQSEWQAAITQGVPFETELRFRRHDGAYGWFSSHGIPIRDNQGRLIKWFGVAADIGEQKRAQEALREIDRRKDEFLAVLSHELRNPLAPIRNAVRILRRPGPLSPELPRLVEMIERQTLHLARLVDDLLDVSRFTRGKINLQKRPIDLVAVVSQVVDNHRPLTLTHRHTMTVNLPPHPLDVEGDEVRLAQVIGNLLTNATKYTPDGGHIWVVAQEKGGQAVVSVRDDGIGLAREAQPQVFQLFTQVSQGLDRAQGGLGIGLSLVKSLVDLHGGRVEVRSEGLGQGSEFIVCLPLLAPESEPSPAASALPPSEAAEARLRGLGGG